MSGDLHINGEAPASAQASGALSPTDSSSTKSPVPPHPPTSFSGEIQSSVDSNDGGHLYVALYDFTGEDGFKELSFKEGDILLITHVAFSEGWHLGEKDGVRGLIPISFVEAVKETEEPLSSPGLGGPVNSALQSQRNSLFGLRQFNRFSWFVTTGVEEFILGTDDTPKKEPLPSHSPSEDPVAPQEDDVERHFIEDGPAWKDKTDLFSVTVHHPERRISPDNLQEHTVFQVTSSFAGGAEAIVERRFTQFEWLLERLQTKFRALVLPPLPEKQYAGRFSDEFIERRRRLLERFMNRLARHSVIRYSEIFTHFLSCQSDSEWTKADKKFLTERHHHGFSFFQKVFHPEFNVDDDGESELVQKFNNHLKSMDKFVPTCYEGIQGFRDHTNEAGNQYRKLSFGLLRLITGSGETSPDCVNDENVWCFKDECEDCLKLTKAMQSVAEHMQSVADTYDTYTANQFSSSTELIKEYTNVSSACAPLVEMHSGVLKKFREITDEENQPTNNLNPNDVEMIKSRCDTVFNVTLAEMNRIHDEKVRDFHTQSIDFIEQQIEFHEKVLEDLKKARGSLLDPQYSEFAQSPRELSKFKLEETPVTTQPLSRPASVTSVTSVMGGMVDGVNSFLKNRARTSIARSSLLGDWIGWKSSGLAKPTVSSSEHHHEP